MLYIPGFLSSTKRVLLFVTVLLGVTSSAFAQEVVGEATPLVKTGEKPPPPECLETLMVSYREGRFDDFVGEATLALEKLGKPDPHILYWRGTAERKLCLFEAALQDFKLLGDFSGWPKYPPASEQVVVLKSMLELRPPHEKKIVVDGEVAFRVFYNEEDEFARSVLEALPLGYKTAYTVLRHRTNEVPVYIYGAKDYDRFVKFFTPLHGSAPHFWWQVLSSSGSITFSESDAKGQLLPPDSTKFSKLISHELTHVFLTRVLAGVRDIPNWFNEGSGMFVESTLEPSMLAVNDKRMLDQINQNTILSLEQMNSHASFHEAADDVLQGNAKVDPYGQGFNMTRYLGYILKGIKFSEFIQEVQREKSFHAALKNKTGLTMKEFYNSWLEDIGAA